MPLVESIKRNSNIMLHNQRIQMELPDLYSCTVCKETPVFFSKSSFDRHNEKWHPEEQTQDMSQQKLNKETVNCLKDDKKEIKQPKYGNEIIKEAKNLSLIKTLKDSVKELYEDLRNAEQQLVIYGKAVGIKTIVIQETNEEIMFYKEQIQEKEKEIEYLQELDRHVSRNIKEEDEVEDTTCNEYKEQLEQLVERLIKKNHNQEVLPLLQTRETTYSKHNFIESSKYTALENRVTSLEKKLEKPRDSYKVNGHKSSSQQIEHVNVENDTDDQEKEELKEKNKQVTDEKLKVEKKIAELQGHLTILNEKFQTTKQILENKDIEQKVLENAIAKKDNELKTISTHLENMQERNKCKQETLEKTIQVLQQRIHHVQTELQEKHLKETNLQNNDQITFLQTEKVTLIKEKESLLAANEKLQKNIKDSLLQEEKLQKKIKRIGEEYSKIFNENEKFEKEINDNKKNIKTDCLTIKEQAEKNQFLEDKIKTYSADIERLQVKYCHLDKECMRLNEINQTSEDHLRNTKQDCKEKIEKAELVLQQKIKTFEREKKEFGNELEAKYKIQLIEMDRKLGEEKRKLEDVEKQRQRIKTKHQIEMQQLREEIKEKENGHHLKCRELENATNKLNTEYQKELVHLKAEKVDSAKQISLLSVKFKEMENNLKEKQIKSSKITDELNENYRKLSEEKEKYERQKEKEMQTLQEKFHEENQLVLKLRKEIDGEKENVSTKDKELKEYRDAITKVEKDHKNSFENEINKYKMEKDKLQKELKEMKDASQKTDAKIVDLCKQIFESETANNNAAVEYAEMIRRIKEIENDLRRSDKENKTLDRELKMKNQTLENTENQLKERKIELENDKKKCENLESSLAQKAKEIDQMKSHLSENEDLKTQLSEKVDDLETQLYQNRINSEEVNTIKIERDHFQQVASKLQTELDKQRTDNEQMQNKMRRMQEEMEMSKLERSNQMNKNKDGSKSKKIKDESRQSRDNTDESKSDEDSVKEHLHKSESTDISKSFSESSGKQDSDKKILTIGKRTRNIPVPAASTISKSLKSMPVKKKVSNDATVGNGRSHAIGMNRKVTKIINDEKPIQKQKENSVGSVNLNLLTEDPLVEASVSTPSENNTKASTSGAVDKFQDSDLEFLGICATKKKQDCRNSNSSTKSVGSRENLNTTGNDNSKNANKINSSKGSSKYLRKCEEESKSVSFERKLTKKPNIFELKGNEDQNSVVASDDDIPIPKQGNSCNEMIQFNIPEAASIYGPKNDLDDYSYGSDITAGRTSDDISEQFESDVEGLGRVREVRFSKPKEKKKKTKKKTKKKDVKALPPLRGGLSALRGKIPSDLPPLRGIPLDTSLNSLSVQEAARDTTSRGCSKVVESQKNAKQNVLTFETINKKDENKIEKNKKVKIDNKKVKIDNKKEVGSQLSPNISKERLPNSNRLSLLGDLPPLTNDKASSVILNNGFGIDDNDIKHCTDDDELLEGEEMDALFE